MQKTNIYNITKLFLKIKLTEQSIKDKLICQRSERMGMNMSIGCNVKACEHHHEQEKYCCLEQVVIDKNNISDGKQSTDCISFKKK